MCFSRRRKLEISIKEVMRNIHSILLDQTFTETKWINYNPTLAPRCIHASFAITIRAVTTIRRRNSNWSSSYISNWFPLNCVSRGCTEIHKIMFGWISVSWVWLVLMLAPSRLYMIGKQLTPSRFYFLVYTSIVGSWNLNFEYQSLLETQKIVN